MELDNSQQNQETKNGWGGARPGSGRKRMMGGEETTRKMRRLFEQYVTEEEIEKIITVSIADALAGKGENQRFILEQIFGKATQRNEHTGADGEQLVFAVAEAIINKNNVTHSEAERDSEG